MHHSDLAFCPIGIFDSGVGGLTVMRQVMKALPHEDIVYFGDTARLPYGNKGQETVMRYCLENVSFLLEKKVKMVIVACNTATAFALDHLRQSFSIPILGVIESGAQKAVENTKTGCIAVLGTRGTIQSGAYQKALQQADPYLTVVPISCPLFVPLVEEGMGEHPATEMIIREYLRELRDYPVDTILLGCTHYPLLYHQIQTIVGNEITLVDSATTCAGKVAELLQYETLMNNQGNSLPQYQYYVSDDPVKFQELGERVFGHYLEQVGLQV